MVGFLSQIAARTDQENPFVGEGQARSLRTMAGALKPGESPVAHVRVNYELGNAELRLGRTREAIRRLESAYAAIPAASAELSPAHANLIIFTLGLAWLRLGENENCVTANPEEGCLFPIREGGVHQRPEGSRNAIPYFEEAMRRATPGDPVDRSARWLLNIAHMTLGTWPDAIAEADRIPREALQGSDFPRFRNVARESGLDVFNLAGGACIDDFDGDHRLDLFTSTWDPRGPVRFFRGDGAGGFTDRTEEANLDGILAGLNVVQGDYDNDGDPDLYVLRGAWLGRVGRHPNSLLRNDGGRFLDVTFASGLGDSHWPTQTAGWADYDNDGDLDLYVGNESSHDSDPERLRSIGYESVVGIRAPSQLFRNEGNGRFTDVAEAAGVTNLRYAKGVTWGDWNDDGFADLYVSNYAGDNRLYTNQGDGTFVDDAPALGVTRPFLSFPTWFWDWNNDGALDLFCSSYSGTPGSVTAHYLGDTDAGNPHEPALLATGDGRGGFRDDTIAAGIDYPMLPMGANFGDLTNDGFLEFYLGTGSPSYANLFPNVLFANQGGERFADVTVAGGFGHLQKGHAVVFADLDRDGDTDLFEQMGGAYPGDAFHDILFRNPGFEAGAVQLVLEGTRSNRSAIGARIRATFETEGETRTVYRHVNSGGSFGANPLRQSIGTGAATVVRELEIRWPATGEVQRFENAPVGRLLKITEGRAEWEVLAELGTGA